MLALYRNVRVVAVFRLLNGLNMNTSKRHHMSSGGVIMQDVRFLEVL